MFAKKSVALLAKSLAFDAAFEAKCWAFDAIYYELKPSEEDAAPPYELLVVAELFYA